MIYRKDFVLCIGADTPEDLEECRKYIKRHGLTEDDVKIKRAEGEYVKVIAKREVQIVGK